ncbi:MAG TPA: O-antigen ligase family protein [Blastocatellia bacterium]|nr:O-antigen ligase family protein [Blastocatellia bacterium]
MSKLLDNAISVGLMLIVAFAALAHGVVEPWSIFVFELATAVLALLWTVKAVADKNLTLVIPQTIWPLAALTLLGLAQSVSWNDGAGVRQSLSLDVENTRGTVLVLCSLLALSVLAANFLTSSRWLLTLTRFLIFFGAVMGVFGLVQYFSGSSSIYWLRHAGGSAFGPFFNRDHFAGYMELLIALPVALIVTSYLCGEKRLVYGIAAMFMGVAAIFTLSRSGMISIFAEMIFIAAMSFRRNHMTIGDGEPGKARMATGLAAIVAILAAIVIGVIWIGAEPVINRIATGDPNSSDLGKTQSFYSVRGEIWENTWTMIRHNPLTGVGLGAYETAYPIYSRENGTQGVTAEAHNDYLQILADAGVIGAIFALWFIWALFRAIARGVRSHDPLMAAVALGGGAGLFGLLVHSVFDFNLHLPSHAMVFLLLSMVISHVGATVDEPVKAESASMSVAPRLMREAS